IGVPASDAELSITPRIINGNDARPGDWPWHVNLMASTGQLKCGGSLIDWFWVITAAHCHITTSDRVLIGWFDVNVSAANNQVLRIVQVFVHPNFNLTMAFNDLALLKLASPAHFHHSVSLLPLPSVGVYFRPGTQCKILGLGYLYPNTLFRPTRLQQATVPLMSVATCKKFWPRINARAMFCAGANGVSFYLGDSGGSVVCRKKGKWTLVGILSFFDKNKHTRWAFVATRVPTYVPWIQEIMAHNKP
ncbi:PREDICTED: chymotrypsinogen B-like, partial [Condylura cristata]|uniref:chymotrypsinogen B-like n=1 Tax=Condylura cristata TaxID=143302 RepID=UPI0006434B4F